MENKIKKIVQISNVLNRHMIEDIGLLGGHAGKILFYQHLAKNQNIKNRNAQKNILKDIETCIKILNQQSNLQFSFCSGISGFGWLLDLIEKEGLLEIEQTDFWEDIDEYLKKILDIQIYNNHFDYLHGVIGIGLYFFRRLDSNYSKNSYELNNIVNYFSQNVKEKNLQNYWLNNFYTDNEDGINIGMAHGISSIIIFLSKVLELDKEKTVIEPLITKALEFIKNQKIPQIEIVNAMYPTFYYCTTDLDSRLSWCYGDLGIGITFWQAGKALGREDWQEEAVDIFIHNSKRRNLEQNGVKDAGLCHGTAGIAHIFNRMYWETKNPLFKETANYWIDETLKMAYHKDGLAGYKTWNHNKEWVSDYSLLTGIAGIGLALLAHISDEEPTWDKCLLLS